MKYKQSIVFGGYKIDSFEYDLLYEICRLNNIKNVLEFGLGVSTFAFLENDCNITTYETDPKYTIVGLKHIDKCKIIYYKYSKLEDIKDENFYDLAFIDGPHGTKTLSRIGSCIFASSRSNHMFLHDYNRKGEQETFEHIKNKDKEWNLMHIKTGRDVGYLYKGIPLVLPEGLKFR